jgi:outer membrane receptor protein involved in Fe transport
VRKAVQCRFQLAELAAQPRLQAERRHLALCQPPPWLSLGRLEPAQQYSATQLPFQPEDVFDIEAGFKAQLLDRRLTIAAAAYHQWYKKIQRTISFIPAPGQALQMTVLNAADATIKGGELEVTAQPISWFELSGSLAYSDPQYGSFIEPSTGADLTANRFAMAPRWTYTLRG